MSATLLIKCDTPTCVNVQMIGRDDPIPKHWLCSICEDHVLEQQLADLARREQDRNRPIPTRRTPFAPDDFTTD